MGDGRRMIVTVLAAILAVVIFLPLLCQWLIRASLPRRLRLGAYYAGWSCMSLWPPAELVVHHELSEGRRADFAGTPFRSSLIKCLFLAGEYEPSLTRVLDAAIREGDVFVDVGANEGFFAVRAAAMGATVLAVYPSPANLRLLRANIARNALDGRVTVLPFAAGQNAGDVTFRESLINGMWSSVGGGVTNVLSRPIRVPMCRLDDLVPTELTARVRAIKIDVEGAESEVLAGAGRLLSDAPALWVVELDPTTPSGARILARFRALGFRARRLAVDSVALPGEVAAPDGETIEVRGLQNMLFDRPPPAPTTPR